MLITKTDSGRERFCIVDKVPVAVAEVCEGMLLLRMKVLAQLAQDLGA